MCIYTGVIFHDLFNPIPTGIISTLILAFWVEMALWIIKNVDTPILNGPYEFYNVYLNSFDFKGML